MSPDIIAVSAGNDVRQFDLLAACQQLYSGKISYTMHNAYHSQQIKHIFYVLDCQTDVLKPSRCAALKHAWLLSAKHMNVQLHVYSAVTHAANLQK